MYENDIAIKYTLHTNSVDIPTMPLLAQIYGSIRCNLQKRSCTPHKLTGAQEQVVHCGDYDIID